VLKLRARAAATALTQSFIDRMILIHRLINLSSKLSANNPCKASDLSTNNPCAIDEAVSRSDAQAHDRATAFH
jgi:hypothetical protein